MQALRIFTYLGSLGNPMVSNRYCHKTNGVYKFEGAVGDAGSPIQNPRLRKPYKTTLRCLRRSHFPVKYVDRLT